MLFELISLLFLQFLAIGQAQDCSGPNELCIPIRSCGPIVNELKKAKSEKDKASKRAIIQGVQSKICGARELRLICCQGEPLGKFTDIFHQIGGLVYKLADDKVAIKNFHYDGQGPDAFFLAGTTGKKPNPAKPAERTLVLPYSAAGDDLKEVYSYTDTDIPILGQYDGSKDLLIQLPPKTSVSDLRWISVWCRDYKINFGHAYLK